MLGRQDDPLRRLADSVQLAVNQQARRTGELERKVDSISRHLATQRQNSETDQLVADLQRREEHYAQVVMLAGYGAFFTLWTQTRSEMSLWMFASTGALISVSLLIFVGFELYKSLRLGRFFRRGPPNVNALTEEVEQLNKHWWLMFALSAGTGMVAGVSLLLWFVYKTILAAYKLSGAA